LYSDEELITILEISRDNNAANNITGLLLYHDGSILQILEGEEAVVKKVFNKISLDTRHKSVIKMVDGSTTKRNFEGWLMGFKQVSEQDWSLIAGYFNIGNRDVFKTLSSSATNQAINLIKSFAHVNSLQ
jgi:hypothetical protein